MARRIPRLEGTEDLFLRARTKGADATVPTAGESDVAPTWRSLRWRRLEGLDEEALVPPPLLALSAEEAFDVAEPEPEEPTPSPQELELALSEAVDLSEDWTVALALAGDTNVARCLPELLEALGWNGTPRQVVELLPSLSAPLDGQGAARVLAHLGFRHRVYKARLNELGPEDFPALFVTKGGDAMVLDGFGQSTIPGFDGASRTRRPFARDRRAGWVYAFSATETVGAEDAGPPVEPLSLVWSMLRRRPRSLTVAALLQGALALAGPLLLLVALDHAVPSASLPMILFFAGAAAFAVIAETPFRVWRDNRVGGLAGLPDRIALACLTRTMALAPESLRPTSSGARQARLRDFHAGGEGPMARIVLSLLGIPAAVIGLAAIALLAGPLAAVPLAGAVLMLLTARIIRGRIRALVGRAVRHASSFRQQFLDIGRVSGEAINCGAETVISTRLDRSAAEAARKAVDAEKLVHWTKAFHRSVEAAGVAGTAVAGAYLIQKGQVTPGALAASLLLSWGVLRTAGRLVGEMGEAARVWCGLSQARKLHALKPERPSGLPSVPPRTLAGHVDVSDLSTAADGGIELPLDGVSLYADPGEVVAVVGDYQSGKSALLRVLAGLQPTTRGHARLDGVETVLLDPVQLRQTVAYVPETPEFLPLTIEENLRLMNPVASEGDIQAACQLAGVMEDIRVLEVGVGANRRFGLSVDMTVFDREPHPGFFKRLALARGYLRRSGLLLLDGPERLLDPEGQQALLRAIEDLRVDTTVIVATDRPEIIRLADRVLWLEGGRVRADGSSSDVLQQLYDEGRVGQTLAE